MTNYITIPTADSDAAQPLHRFACDAMGTTFEIIAAAESEDYVQQAATAAFQELGRLEGELSRFIDTSDVAQINALAVGESVRVGAEAFECLQLAARVCADTNGAFDVTFTARRDQADAQLVELDEKEHTVRAKVDGPKVDLGGIGKGYAVDHMVGLLREWSIEAALVHSGESTVFATGEDGWPISLRDPEDQERAIRTPKLCDRALSGSGVRLHGAHIIDPRAGRPAQGKLATWALAPSAALADGLSTAFMVMDIGEVEDYCRDHADVAALIMPSDSKETVSFGEWQ